MNNLNPSTDEIRAAWRDWAHAHISPYISIPDLDDAFDRWLRGHQSHDCCEYEVDVYCITHTKRR